MRKRLAQFLRWLASKLADEDRREITIPCERPKVDDLPAVLNPLRAPDWSTQGWQFGSQWQDQWQHVDPVMTRGGYL